MAEAIDKVAQFRLRYSALVTENQNLTVVNTSLKNQVDSLISSREEERKKYLDDTQGLRDAYKNQLDEQLARYQTEVEALKEGYKANTTRILDALDEAYKARTAAQVDADSWKTKFNEYLKNRT